MADEPRQTLLRRLLQQPEARKRVQPAVLSLLGVSVFAVGAFGVLVIWHLVRRGRLIRERLVRPRDVSLVDPLERDAPE